MAEGSAMESLAKNFRADKGDFDGPVLVTGAGGCIGSWVLAILVRAGVPVVAFDLSDDRRRPALLMSERELAEVAWVIGDIGDNEAVANAVASRGIRAIIHLAALQVPFCKANPAAGAQANVVGTVNVLEAARHNALRRVAYASSVAAHALSPGSPYLATLYGAFKACDEMIGRVFFQDWGVPSVGIRPGVVYGIGRDQGMTSKTTVAILAAAAGKPFNVPFTGPTSYLYAGEAASAFVASVSRERDAAGLFDLNGATSSVEAGLDVIRILAPGARLDSAGDPLPFPADLSDEPIRDFLGEFGSISMHEGIAETYRAFEHLLANGQVSPESVT